MKYWILNHKFSSYEEHRDLIGLPVRKDKKTGELVKNPDGTPRPYYTFYNEINIGDKLIYYCPAPKKAMIGVFEIIAGPQRFSDDWSTPIQYRIKPIFPVKEENYISYYTLVDNLDFFLDEDGNRMAPRSAAYKLLGTIKELNLSDFNRVVAMIKDNGSIGPPTPPITEPTPPEISLHIQMIKTTHLQADQFQCESYIGYSERRRVINSISTENEEMKIVMTELPSWMVDISTALRTNKRINNIDNLWFFEESKGFFIPFAIFEHEKDGNLRTVMDHFSALNNTLINNKRFKNINPLYFIIGKDDKQIESYKKRISEHGEWRQFKQIPEFFIFSIKELEERKPEFVSTLTNHLVVLMKK